MRKRVICILAFCFAVIQLLMAQATIGYTTGTCGRDNMARFGGNTKQGMAIKLTGEKLKTLKGVTLKGASAVVGSRNTSQYEAFVRTSLDGANLAQATISAPTKTNAWGGADFTFASPYTITGEEPCLYVGYTCEAGTYTVLSYDFTQDSRDVSFALSDGEWIDTYGTSFGMPNLRVVVSGKSEGTDLMMKTYTLNGFLKVNEEYPHGAAIFNFGQTTVTGFDILVKVGNGEQKREHISDVTIAPGEEYTVEFPAMQSAEPGRQQVVASIENIVTAAGVVADADPSDNTTGGEVFLYPEGVEKNILIETFTSQACSNCPTGHRATHEAVAYMKEAGVTVNEVTHHAGYQADVFTMAESGEYCFFYGSNSTFAPAIMLNRWHSPLNTAHPGPVFNTGYVDILNTASVLLDRREPYVQLHMSNEFNPETGAGKVSVNVECIHMPESQQNVLNVFLSQDGLVAYQVSGGGEYVYDNVFRGTLTGSAWGVLLPLEEGKVTHYEKEYTLPKVIASTAGAPYAGGEPQVAIEPASMHVTAFVAAYSSTDYNANEVYNSLQIPLLDDGSGVQSLESRVQNTERVTYNLQGQKVGSSYKGLVIKNGRKYLQK